MTPAALLLALATAAPPSTDLQTEFWQVAPGTAPKRWAAPDKPVAGAKAVVLIPGLHIHPLRPSKVAAPELSRWQLPKSDLVKTLAAEFDVFAFAYSQTLTVDEIAQAAALRDAVAELRKAGYKEIVLVGHSAGAVIGRHFVEQNPDAGVTRVIAVAPPFAGAGAATLNVGYPKAQAPFVKSLTPVARKDATKQGNALGKDIEFACVVCKLKRSDSDGVVPTRSQWPEDLQQLGVPAVLAQVSHIDAMDDSTTAKAILQLAKGKLTRWSPEEVETARKVLFGEQPASGNFLRRQAK